MDVTSTLAMAMGSSWLSGVNLYATVATLGLLGRFANVQLPGSLDSLTSWWVIGIAGCMYAVEFVADKIPAVDTAWDAVHTFIRVPAGAVLAAASFAKFDSTIQTVALLVGGGLALTSHGTKATARAAINTSPEPVSNIAASTAEDVLAIGGASLAVFYPAVIIGVVVVGVIASFIIIPKIIGYLRRVIGFVGNWREKLRNL
ncbi:MAG: DUF4126 domain-containing protein [Candidatus Kapabacteria bacterium]|jgi:hypothetical protein|nr:DUF4126 domain-containing protein [Candidatus Kapabacteria bacterium]